VGCSLLIKLNVDSEIKYSDRVFLEKRGNNDSVFGESHS
jgi:hypothetical protein